jgi:hypothetical protein
MDMVKAPSCSLLNRPLDPASERSAVENLFPPLFERYAEAIAGLGDEGSETEHRTSR